MSHLIPDRRLRNAAPGRSFTVPEVVVTVEPGHAAPDTILATVEQVLASDMHDLTAWVDERPAESFESLHRLLDPDPRAQVGPAGGAPDHHPQPRSSSRSRGRGDQAEDGRSAAPAARGGRVGESDLVSGHRVAITRAWALNRARRGGLAVSEVGDVVELDVDSLKATQEPQPQSRLAARLQGPVKVLLRVWTRLRRHLSTVLDAARRIRSLGDVGRFVAMVGRAVWWRLRNLRWKLRRLRKWPRRVRKRLKICWDCKPRAAAIRTGWARYPLGAEITTSGRVASAVLAASSG